MDNYKPNRQNSLKQWWSSSLGLQVLQQEKVILQSLSPYFHGDRQLQLGPKLKILPYLLQQKQQIVMAIGQDLQGHNEALPIKSHCLDTLLLSHVLEFSDDPHQVLREVERVLVADGIVSLCSFNPWSLWGLRRLCSWQDKTPWNGRFFSQTRTKDWLALLNFEIIATEKYLFCPAIASQSWFTRFSFMERWGKRLWPLFSGGIIIVATKRTIPLTPISRPWQTKRLFPTGSFVNNPVSRDKNT